MPKLSRIKLTVDVTEGDLRKVVNTLQAMISVKDDEVQTLLAGLKGELPQIIKDVKSGFIKSRATALEDYSGRLDTAIRAANEWFKKNGDDEEEVKVDVKGPWTYETGDLTAAPKGAEEDFETLLDRKPNLFRGKIGTIVGGNGIKTGTKVDGLNHDSARIDVQSPPEKGVLNVQFQVGKASIACVLFTPEDSESDVFAEFRESFKKKKKAISPRAKAIINAK